MTAALDPLTGLLSAVAMQAEARFRDHNLSVRGSRVVHAVAMTRWMAGVTLPAPACHVGVAGWAIEDLHPTSDAVTCLRCLRAAPGGRAAIAALAAAGGQLALPLDVAERSSQGFTRPRSGSDLKLIIRSRRRAEPGRLRG